MARLAAQIVEMVLRELDGRGCEIDLFAHTDAEYDDMVEDLVGKTEKLLEIDRQGR
jgi:hypothetical protein